MARDKYHTYIQAWRARFRQEAEEDIKAKAEARGRAGICAECLVEQFGAERVYLIGSLARPGKFHQHSDVDLAVVGLAPERYFQALSEMGRLAGREVDLILLEDATADMVSHIKEEGIVLYERPEVPAS
jgi:predicted nucleotidyltransferase